MANLYRLSNLKTELTEAEQSLEETVAERLSLPVDTFSNVKVVKESIDARKSPRVYFVRQVEFQTARPLADPLPHDLRLVEKSRLDVETPPFMQTGAPKVDQPVVVIGAGPAGLFAALALIEAKTPVILLERGKPVETRMRDIGQLRSHGTLDPESNVCFGEGGAGAYTDGKLYTRIKHPFVRWVMQRLVDFQAPEQILIDAHPHLGTDKLVRIVKRLREHLVDRGVDVRFGAKVTRIETDEGRVKGVHLADDFIPTDRVVMAIGHSARDTLAQLHRDGVAIEPKPFAVGVRVEHPQVMINHNQYGSEERHRVLGAAAYQLTYQAPDPILERRGVYSFCMCPGGFIVPSPTEPDHMAINGMSNANRSTAFANAGIVVQVTPEDLRQQGYEASPLIGFAFQRDLEARAFRLTKDRYAAPAMRISDFIARKAGGTLAPTNFRPAAEPADLWEVMPGWVAEPLALAFENFNYKIKGFTSEEGNMLAIESRTSSPVRVTRGDDLQSVSAKGLYPVGEGAGYAGGIVSAAVDGVRAAQAIIEGFA